MRKDQILKAPEPLPPWWLYKRRWTSGGPDSKALIGDQTVEHNSQYAGN